MRKKFLIVISFVGLVLTAGCEDTAQVEVKPPLVKTVTAQINDSVQNYNYSGTVCSRYETNLAFQVGGRILNRNVQVGSFVRTGDILMSIDSRDVVQHSNQGEAQVAAAKAQLDLAESNLKRYSQLYKDDAISASVLDQYQTSYDSALASYQNAVAQAKQTHNELTYTNLIANADGVISAVNAEQGQVVSAGQTVMTLSQTDELEVEINVPENRISDIEIGKPVNIKFWSTNDESVGNIREVSPIADSTSRTYRVRVSLPQPPTNVQLGMTINASISSQNEQLDGAVILPLSAIYQTDDKPQVWIVSDGKVTLKPVVVANFDDNNVLVRGLNAGDLIVSAGVNKLRAGQSVRVE